MCNWELIKNEYEGFVSNNETLGNELLWLDNNYESIKYDSDSTWNELSDNEKRIKRFFWSKMAQKTEGYDNGFFRFEESIIDLYEAITSVLNKIETLDIKHLQVLRLKAHLCLVKRNINICKNIREIKDLYYEQLKSVIYYCINCDLENYFIKEVNILYLESRLEIAQRLINKNI